MKFPEMGERGLFSGAFAVSFREGNYHKNSAPQLFCRINHFFRPLSFLARSLSCFFTLRISHWTLPKKRGRIFTCISQGNRILRVGRGWNPIPSYMGFCFINHYFWIPRVLPFVTSIWVFCVKWPFQGLYKWPPFGWSKGHEWKKLAYESFFFFFKLFQNKTRPRFFEGWFFASQRCFSKNPQQKSLKILGFAFKVIFLPMVPWDLSQFFTTNLREYFFPSIVAKQI